MAKKELKYPPEFKKEVCEYAKKESIIYASILYNLHRNTIGNWVKKYKKSGIKGFAVIRNDTQETKLDKTLLEKIARYKRINPKATLKMIREKFELDCHLTLISRKLKKVYVPEKRKKQNEVLFLRTKIIREAGYKDNIHPGFRLSLHICSGKPLAVGFTNSYNSEKICLFIRYSLEKLKMLKKCGDFKKIVTSAKFIKNNDFTSIVGSLGNYELDIISSKDYKFCNENDIALSKKNLKYSLADTYDEILADYDSNELNEALLVSLVNINELSKNDISKNKWDTLYLPAETKKSLYATLDKIRDKGNKAVMDFDYDTARGEYHKAYTALTVLNIENKELKLSFLKAKAMLYYNSEKYQTALMLFRDIARFAKTNKIGKELADSYYHIAMIYRSFQNITGAVKYFKMSAKSFENRTDVMSRALYYRAKYRIYLAQGNYKEAEKYSDLYYTYSHKTSSNNIIGNCLSTYGLFLYYSGRYEEFEKILFEAKKYNSKYSNLYELSNNITNLFSIYSYYILKEEKEINELLNELKVIARQINMPQLLYESMYRIGIYYYNKSRNDEALRILKKALPGVKKFLDKESYLSVMCYIGGLYYTQNNYPKALRVLKPMIEESFKANNNVYMLRGIKYLSSIYLEMDDAKKAVWLIKKGIKISINQGNIFACATYHKLYAEHCEKNKMIRIAFYHYSESLRYFLLFKKENKYDISKEIEYLKTKIECCN
ncbi:MAG TPA: hypothetical protein PLK90_09645 [Clostridiales bacterium]|nr:hypothetical protein [Clostridiales bacterium]HQP70648.1 hypothetical protein [Clostridiales bacterium]